MLFGSKHKPDSNKYTLWTDSVHLTDPLYHLHSPFNFDSYSDVISTNQHVALIHREYFFTVCNTLDIVYPILSTLTDVKSSTKKQSHEIDPSHTAKRSCTHNTVDMVINSRVVY